MGINGANRPRRIRARERDCQAVELRAAGLTFAAIGAQLGVSDGQRFGLSRKTQDEPDPESGHTETIWARGTGS